MSSAATKQPELCLARSSAESSFRCALPKGHEGRHVSRLAFCTKTWPNEEPSRV